MTADEKYMRQCLIIAGKGLGNVAPNPMVGCVIVYKNKIIGKGYHKQFGKTHAEVNAINNVKNKSLLKKSTLYVSLEPCSHQGKTPPCSELIIKHRIPYVVIGSIDTNPLVKGRGISKLIKAGTDVKVGVLDSECRDLNRRFFCFHENKRPFIILKWAQSKDKFISKNSDSLRKTRILRISNEASHKLSHKWRTEEQAIMIGTNTAFTDNPKLTARKVKGKNPIRILIDRELKTPEHYHLLNNKILTLVFTEQSKTNKKNIEYIPIDFNKNVLIQVLTILYKKNISSVIVEGGAILINSFIKQNLWDEARVFCSASLLKQGVKAPALPHKNTAAKKTKIGTDTLYNYYNSKD